MTLYPYKPSFVSIKILLIIFFNILCVSVKSQFVNTGTEPASVKWDKIETQHYIVIYPRTFEAMARNYAQKLELSYLNVNYSIGFQPKKYAYVLHTYSANSNGLTAIAPNRVELWTKPHQDVYGQAWDEQLIIHEGRHVAQFSSMYRGASKLPILLLGEMAYAFPIGLFVPNWFMEGDAVVAETALTEYGRGRLPEFEKTMRAYMLQKGNPGYDKMMLGSYKDFMPNHYETGYQIVAANRAFRDRDIFKDKLEDIARYPWWLWPFSRKSNGFKDTRKLKYYKFAADTLERLWQLQEDIIDAPKANIIYKNKDFTGLEYLRASGDKLFAMQRNMDNVPRIVEIGSDETKKIISLGYGSGKYFDVNDDVFVFTLEMPDLRWEQLSESSIYAYDVVKGVERRITRGGSYFSPVLNPDNKIIAAAEVSDKNDYNIALINFENGELIRRLPNPSNAYIITPQWNDDGSQLVYIKLTAQGKELAISDLTSETVLFESKNIDIKHPFLKNDTVYFVGDWSGIENIYALPLCGGEPKRLSNSRFGAVSPVFKKNALCYLDYDYKGNFVADLPRNNWLGEPLRSVKDNSIKLYEKLAEQELGVIDFTANDTLEMEHKSYSKFLHQFNFHSWMPGVGFKLDDGAYIPGVSIVSQSLLNDATIAIGYNPRINDPIQEFYINYAYRGWFPVISFNSNSYYQTTKSLRSYGGYYSSYDEYYRATYESEYSLIQVFETKAELPFVKRSLDYSIGLLPNIELSSVFLWNIKNYNYGNTGLRNFSFGAGLSSYILKQKAYRDLFSPLGYNFKFQKTIQYKREFSSEISYDGNYEFYNLDIFLPGFIAHNSFQIHSSYIKLSDLELWNGLSFESSLPVGWTTIVNEGLSEKNYRIGFEYVLPVGNIDAEIFWLTYLKRLNIGFWGDYGRFENLLSDGSYSSRNYSIVGATGFLDMNFFRYPVEFKVGAKAGYSLSHEKPYVNIIFNFNF